MAALENVYDFEHLFSGYLEDYKAARGDYPRSPRMTFLQAANAAAERILQNRRTTT
jgi:hypothetical protein